MNNLTTIAALPMGGGCASKLDTPAKKKFGPSMTHRDMAGYVDGLLAAVENLQARVISLEKAAAVQMRSAYFQEQLDEETPLVWPAIDLGVFE